MQVLLERLLCDSRNASAQDLAGVGLYLNTLPGYAACPLTCKARGRKP